MKNAGRISVLSLGMLMTLSACTGNYDSNPLKKYSLDGAKRPVETADDLRKQEVQPEIRYVDREVVKEVPRNVLVEVQKNFVAAQLFQIQNVSPLSFVAGTQSQVNFDVRFLHGTAQFTARAEGLPDGASLKEIAVDGNKKTYALVFKPAVNSISASSLEEIKSIRIRLALQSFTHEDKDKEAQIKQAFASVDNSKSFDLTVRRNRENPQIDKIVIPEVIGENEVQPVSIAVSAPGTYEGYAPTIKISYEFENFSEGLLENNGATFLKASTSRKAVEFVSEGKWIFNLDLNTKATSLIPPQLDKKLQVVASDVVLFRVNIFVKSPTGATSDEKVIKYKIAVKRAAVTAGSTGL